MQKLCIANWKSNKTEEMVTAWFRSFSNAIIPEEAKVILAPPAHLWTVTQRLLPTNMHLAAQDVSPFPMGSYTGAISAQQLKDASVHFALIGHSERRRYFHETYSEVASKVSEAINNAVTPIVCLDKNDIAEQAAALDMMHIPSLVVAYEPVAAIGSGNNAPIDDVVAVKAQIKAVFGDVPVVYGGSVDERAVKEYLMVTDGVLVGSASLDPLQFEKIVQAVKV